MPVLQTFETTLIDIDPVHVSELPVRVLVSPLGVMIVPTKFTEGTSVSIALKRGRLELIVNAGERRASKVIKFEKP